MFYTRVAGEIQPEMRIDEERDRRDRRFLQTTRLREKGKQMVIPFSAIPLPRVPRQSPMMDKQLNIREDQRIKIMIRGWVISLVRMLAVRSVAGHLGHLLAAKSHDQEPGG